LALSFRAGGQMVRPPLAPMRPVTNSYFGIEVVDPFRWMEEAASPEMRQWMKAESDYARAALEGLPARQRILEELRQLDSTLDGFPGALNLAGSRWFYVRTPPPTDVYQLFMREGLKGKENLIFDPQTLRSAEGGHYSLNLFHPAPDGKYAVCPVSRGDRKT
jgi:prolyl oligopeptidase